VGAGAQPKDQVGTLLLGGKPRTVSVPAKADSTAASKGASPRIHVVRLPRPSGATATTVTALRPKAS